MKKSLFFILLIGLLLVSCSSPPPIDDDNVEITYSSVATFAGGCFWCTESDFEKVDGVVEVISGYTSGTGDDPTYKTYGSLGFTEAVQVYYDPSMVSYKELVEHHWMTHDPTDADGQFIDRGKEYRPGIYYQTEEERLITEDTKQDLIDSQVFAKPIVSEILSLENFYPAEEYHQDYYKKNPIRYKIYRGNSGRDQFLEATWGSKNGEPLPVTADSTPSSDFVKPTEEELKEMLTPLQYKVTQKDGTERAYDNEYWDHKEQGIYVDVVSGEALFSSTDKYDSKTGWPSFSKSIDEENLVKKTDYKLVYPRTELRSKQADSHLGHLFSDGPEPTGLRYCINSAALRFVPLVELEKEGYGQYQNIFTQT